MTSIGLTRQHWKYSREFPGILTCYLKGAEELTAFVQCLLGCHASLYRYARALVHELERAEELVQETYKRALASKRRPDPATPEVLRAWSFTIMRHIWQNNFRHIQVEQAGAREFETVDIHPETPDTVLERKLLQSEIVRAIESLPAEFREVIVLREIEGCSYAEIAKVLGCPPGTVMSRLSRARKLLRRLLSGFVPFRTEMRS